jgi:hypothetical protein
MINVWVGQSQALKAEVEAIKLEASPERVKGEIKEKVAKIVPKEIKGTAREREDYVRLASKIADKTDGLFRAPRIKAKAMSLESLYVDSVDEIAALQKGGATILGAWHWSGEQVEGYPPHKDIGKFMPPRYETDENGDTTEIVDETPRDIVCVWGQSPREFA